MRMRRPSAVIGIGCIVASAAVAVVAEDENSENGSLKIDDEHLMVIDADADERRQETADEDGKLRRLKSQIGRLAQENRNLREKVLALKREMSTMSISFSALKSRYRQLSLSRESAVRKRELSRYGRVAGAPEAVPLLDANEELQMVVLGAGVLGGMSPGLIYRVVREGKVLASVRVVLVRWRIAGAKVIEKGKSSFPAAGDRAVLGRARKRSD